MREYCQAYIAVAGRHIICFRHSASNNFLIPKPFQQTTSLHKIRLTRCLLCVTRIATKPLQEVPPVPTSTYSQAPLSPTLSGQDNFGGVSTELPLNTLDEPIWETVKRDLVRIGANLVLVVFPFKNWDQQSAALRNWDLWGPMAFTLTLAITLSVGSHQASTVFSADLGSLTLQLVFGVCAAGAIILTVNANLLGGNIGFFQSMCLLGYCLFPLDVAALVTSIVTNIIARWIVVSVSVIWASWASVPFIGGSVPPARRALAVFPLLLLYTAMGWLALVKG